MSWSEGWQTWEAMPGVTIEIFHAKGANASRAYALITGGIHGDEYEGPAAALEFIKQLDPTALQGSLTVVPVANPPAFAAGTRTNPDGRNLARCFPGTHGGSDTERLAHAIFHHLLEGVTHLIDLHSGGVEYIFLPVAGFYGDASSSNRSFAAPPPGGFPPRLRFPATPRVQTSEAEKPGTGAIGCL
jgi:predicted deacylase